MGSLLRAIAAAVLSWFRTARGRRARLNSPADRTDSPRSDSHTPARVETKSAPGHLRIDLDGPASLRLPDDVRSLRPEGRIECEDEKVHKARRRTEEASPLPSAAGARHKAAEEERARVGAEDEACRQAEEAARIVAEAEARRRTVEAESLTAEAEARRKADEEGRARVAAEAEERHQAEETERLAAGAEARRKAEEGERARADAEREAHRQTVEAARLSAEAEARRKADEEDRARVAAEAEECRQAEEAAHLAFGPDARHKPAEDDPARPAAEAKARRLAEDAARLASEAEARLEVGRKKRAAHYSAAQNEAEPAVEEESGGEEPGAESEPAASPASRTRAPRYRGPAGGPPAPRQPPPSRPTTARRVEATAAGSHALPVELRLLFDRGDSLRVTLLPKRTSGLPDELTIPTSSGTVDLVALEDNWYQDVAPDNLGSLLRDGVLWMDESTGQEWVLSGREVFVLASGTAHRGLVSCPRLVLGREHAVLCTTSLLVAVEAVLRQAECDGWTPLDENDGAPRGWLVLRGVVPRRPVPWTDTADILNALRPLPEVEIALDGGICLGYASWLAEHPPAIRVYGDPDHARAVRIDGQNATVSADARYTTPGWDSLGLHQVWCNGTTRTYSLLRREPSTQAWAAFSFPSPARRGGARIAICGPLVRAFAKPEAGGEDAATCETIQVPPANPVLLGSLPGQLAVTYPRPDLHGAQCIASPPFAPVWALPAQALLCDKRENRIRLVGEPLAPGNRSRALHATAARSSIEQWCSAILDAGRKGLMVEPATPAVADLWHRYRRYARDFQRRIR